MFFCEKVVKQHNFYYTSGASNSRIMFSISFRRFFIVGDRVIVRNLRNTGRLNPGVQKRINAFQGEGLKIQDDSAEELVEQSESDFYNVGAAYNEHLNESVAGKLDLRHHIVKEKFFKEHLPNFLTWSEKEQIRHLATTDPEEWTPEKIAESFPVTVAVVKKLLKHVWRPATAERIARHDQSAMRNWKQLKDGSLGIPEDLCQHFLKFSERSIPPLSQTSIKVDLTQQRKIGEFESIVQRCAAKEEQKQIEGSTEETDLRDGSKVRKDTKRVTLDGLADRIKMRLEKGKNIDANDTLMLDSVNSERSKQELVIQNIGKEIELPSEESRSKEITQYKEAERKLEIDYLQRIRIPKRAYKKGATYKVNDCYYDHHGQFLYRVLGMHN